MFFPFVCLLMFCGVVGVLVWLGWQRITAHMQQNPEAAKLVAEHVIAPLLMGGKKPEESPKEEQPNIGLENNGQTILTSNPK
jgi:hypothetical protein